MIVSFADRRTEQLYDGTAAKGVPADVLRRAVNKLVLLDTTLNLQDLRVPPSNHLEALKGDRQGQHSIRINDQWRICFTWFDGNAHDVEFCDYH